ncbi:hypothetical protein RD792_008654 [Penstemon davidsonii]|uniref:Kinesin motor domain-containing protein n=1 Tax=Penstemon davidsonii TaxID=160366 RepID=A0ABR0D9V2_9LAMI|nr:hypothetical protein RD792_008654 [Penstemon davidsonii]
MGTTMESGEELIKISEERIYVSVRLRPLNSKEILRNDVSDWECINDKTVVYKNATLSVSERSMYPSAYTFDRVFRSGCSTREVYEKGAKDVAISVVSGMNASVFAYGQTSSGKTYTMTGITEYAIADIYEYIQKHPEREFVLKFSAMEIYNESVRDLLSVDSTPLRLLDDPERGTIVEKLTEETLRDWDHVIQLLSVCEAQRQNGETSLNEMSSRSHQIIRLTIESSSREFLGRDRSILAAAVNFVDLAGSERASQSLSAGTRLKEGCHINRSLLTLGTVIRKLSKGRNGHIPYRDSKLTRILQTSLGGNARTAIICTMSPARTHVEQSRNTLLFASCAKEVTTNAQVNVLMSDKALVKHLQRELARLESEIISPQLTFTQPNYTALLREKDLQIEKLEEEIKNLILQRDIAQSQVKDMLQMLGDDASTMIRVGSEDYPHLRVQKSPDTQIQEHDTSHHSLDIDIPTSSNGHSRTSSEDHYARVQYLDENFVHGNSSPRILINSSNFSESDSFNNWEDIEKQSNGTSEDLCKEVRCIETEESSSKGANESNYLSSEERNGYPEIKVSVNENEQAMKLPSSPSEKDQEFVSPPLKNDYEMKEDIEKEDQELISTSLKEDRESILHLCKKENEFSSMNFLDISSLEKLSSNRSLKLAKSRSCNSAPQWFKTMDYSENNSSIGSERELVGSERKISPFSFGSNEQILSRKDSHSSPENALDIEIDTPNVKFSTSVDVISIANEVKEKAELPTDQDIVKNLAKDIEPNAKETPKKNVKDVGLDPIEDEYRGLSSWPVEFKRLQREILELWNACNVSLVHRTYFFLLFQGDPSDAIYLEVELRRMKYLKDKFSRGEKTIVNGRQLSLASSTKALRHERQMLSKQMMKKLSEQERESLFLKWGIGLNTKLRRLQLAHQVWINNEDINHITDSAFLVAKLVGFIEPGQAPNKEMFGLNFTPRSSTSTYSFKRSLISLL